MAKVDLKTKIKGNIPIKKELLNKYKNAEEIFAKERKNYKVNIIINTKLEILQKLNLQNLNINEIKKIAYNIFSSFHNNYKFYNQKYEIIVSKRSIFESIQKIYHTRKQRELIKEHLIVFSCLGKIIEEATLVNQVFENKGRVKYKCWNYFLDGIIINNKKYLLEFDVVAMDNNENHYRIQRIELI